MGKTDLCGVSTSRRAAGVPGLETLRHTLQTCCKKLDRMKILDEVITPPHTTIAKSL